MVNSNRVIFGLVYHSVRLGRCQRARRQRRRLKRWQPAAAIAKQTFVIRATDVMSKP